MAIIFPGDCTTPTDRTEYCYRAQELLRKLHNVFGRWYREGITQNVWNQLPVGLRTTYPYKAQLTQIEWESFFNTTFEPKSNKITEKLLLYRQSLKDSVQWIIDIEDI